MTKKKSPLIKFSNELTKLILTRLSDEEAWAWLKDCLREQYTEVPQQPTTEEQPITPTVTLQQQPAPVADDEFFWDIPFKIKDEDVKTFKEKVDYYCDLVISQEHPEFAFGLWEFGSEDGYTTMTVEKDFCDRVKKIAKEAGIDLVFK